MHESSIELSRKLRLVSAALVRRPLLREEGGGERRCVWVGGGAGEREEREFQVSAPFRGHLRRTEQRKGAQVSLDHGPGLVLSGSAGLVAHT